MPSALAIFLNGWALGLFSTEPYGLSELSTEEESGPEARVLAELPRGRGFPGAPLLAVQRRRRALELLARFHPIGFDRSGALHQIALIRQQFL